MAPAHVVAVRARPGEPRDWATSVAPLREVDGAFPARGSEDLSGVECVLVEGSLPEPLRLARRIHAADPSVQVVVVAAPGEHARLQHAVLFTPGVGEVWLAAPAEAEADLVERARAVTRQRRSYRATRAQVERGLARAEEPLRVQRAQISDAFLAALLQALPDPVLSVDSAGRVLSWNPAAERVLGFAAHEAVGRPLAEVLSPAGTGEVEQLLRDAAGGRRIRELGFRRKGGETGIGEVVATPVETAGRGIVAVILHDVTVQRQAQGEMETQAAHLQEQAAELEVLNDELQERTRSLEAALGTRSRFYANMSHELRTPINAIIGFNALILDGIFGPVPERQAEGLRRSQRAAHHLMELVNDVLDIAKVEAGRIEVDVETVAFPTLLEELADTVRLLAREHGSELSVTGPEREHTVRTDPRRVRQILLNLLSNAIKFGDGKPIVVAWAAAGSGGVEVSVTDRGRGIAAEHQERIFEEFAQLGPRSEGGTGLGLAISRQLARLLGGDVGVESEPGRGSAFTLRLPAAPPPAA